MEVDTPATIVILGAGPIGLEAALYARYLGYAVEVYERGEVCENVLAWGHVRMFSPFGMNASPLGLAALAAQDESFSPPAEDALLTGAQWAQQYLIPLSRSDLLNESIHQQTTVVAVGRGSLRKGEHIGRPERAHEQFRIILRDAGGNERATTGDVVIDTTGTFGNTNWLGAGGLPAIGELAARQHIDYGLPDVLGGQRERYAGRHTLVVGSGYSAATNVVALAELAAESPDTKVTWLTRGDSQVHDGEPIRRIESDRLAARDELAQRANALAVEGDVVTHLPGAFIQRISVQEGPLGFTVELDESNCDQTPSNSPFAKGRKIDESPTDSSLPTVRTVECDRIIANVGFRPDASLYEELQVHQCYATGGPMKLAAALLGETSADCLEQNSHGPQTLLTSEPNFYILGSKSYGRNSNFLVSIGLAQIRELFSIIAGREDLDLYATMNADSPRC